MMTSSQSVIKQAPVEFAPNVVLCAKGIDKTFTLHNQGGIQLPVLENLSIELMQGECVVLTGVSGSGKSSLMKALYGNYGIHGGEIWVKHDDIWVDLAQLKPYEIISVRQKTIGYVSQFLRVIPRISALDVAAEPLLDLGWGLDDARNKIQELFSLLNLPERLWQLSPTTFSGGEKQRVNLARALAIDYPILLLDEPTSALDAENTQSAIALLRQKKQVGTAMLAIVHDAEIKQQLGDREYSFG